MAYLKRVTPIYGAYKTITLSVLAFILIAGCVLFIVELVKHRETFRLGNTVPQVSGGKKALVYWTAPVTIVCVIVSLAMAIVNAIG